MTSTDESPRRHLQRPDQSGKLERLDLASDVLIHPRPPRRAIAVAVVVVMIIDVSGCAGESTDRTLEVPANHEGRDPTAAVGARSRAVLPRVIRPDAPIFVDARVASRASRRTLPASTTDHLRTVTLVMLEERLAGASGMEGADRDAELVEVTRQTLKALEQDGSLFDLHPVHAYWRAAYTQVLVAAVKKRAERDVGRDLPLPSQTGDGAIDRRCPPSAPSAAESTLLDARVSTSGTSEASGDGSNAPTESSRTSDAFLSPEQMNLHERACGAFFAGEYEQAADSWLAIMFASNPSAALQDHAWRSDLHLLHLYARWFQYAVALDIEALVTARESLRIRLLEDERLYDGSAGAAGELAATVAALDELDGVLLASRRETWQLYAMDAEKVVARARRRARLDVGSGVAMIVTGSLVLALPVPFLFLLSGFAGPTMAIAAGIWGIATAIVVGLGVKRLRQGRRAHLSIVEQTWSIDGPDHWFQPGVGRRLRDPSGLYVIDRDGARSAHGVTTP
jgi:hypothetical protein